MNEATRGDATPAVPAVLPIPSPPASSPPSVADADPAGLGLQVQATVTALLLALGFAEPEVARWALVAQSVIGLAILLWTRRKAWSPAAVARKLWEERDAIGRYLTAVAETERLRLAAAERVNAEPPPPPAPTLLEAHEAAQAERAAQLAEVDPAGVEAVERAVARRRKRPST